MEEQERELGPIDYLVVEFPEHEADGQAFAELLSLVDRGIIHVLDLVFVRKQQDGSVVTLSWQEAAHGVPEIEIFEGAHSGLIGDDDFAEVAEALDPDAAAAILVYENLWALPFVSAVKRNGGLLVATGRIPVQSLIDAINTQE